MPNAYAGPTLRMNNLCASDCTSSAAKSTPGTRIATEVAFHQCNPPPPNPTNVVGQPTPACAILSRPRLLGQGPAPELQQNASRQTSRGGIVRGGWRGCSGESVWRDARTEQSRSRCIVSCSLKPRSVKPRPRLAIHSDLARPPSVVLAATWFARQRLPPKIHSEAPLPSTSDSSCNCQVRPCEPVVVSSAMPSCMPIVWCPGSECLHPFFFGSGICVTALGPSAHRQGRQGWLGPSEQQLRRNPTRCITEVVQPNLGPTLYCAPKWEHRKVSSGVGSCADRFAFGLHLHICISRQVHTRRRRQVSSLQSSRTSCNRQNEPQRLWCIVPFMASHPRTPGRPPPSRLLWLPIRLSWRCHLRRSGHCDPQMRQPTCLPSCAICPDAYIVVTFETAPPHSSDPHPNSPQPPDPIIPCSFAPSFPEVDWARQTQTSHYDVVQIAFRTPTSTASLQVLACADPRRILLFAPQASLCLAPPPSRKPSRCEIPVDFSALNGSPTSPFQL